MGFPDGQPAPATATRDEPPAVDVVVPVHNEERELESHVRRLHSFLARSLPFTFRVTIVDNGSTDRTWEIARALVEEFPTVRAMHIPEKGRGRALQAGWAGNQATVLAYMDVDLSTDLAAFLPLVEPLLAGEGDLAIGNRLSPQSRVVRGAKREFLSRCYNGVLRATLHTRFSDAQCGFKAIRGDRARVLLPHVRDTGWFFDTELLVLAERSGLRIHEVPVDWIDDPDSRVALVPTAVADLKGIVRLVRGLRSGAIPVAALRRQLDSEVPAGPGAGQSA